MNQGSESFKKSSFFWFTSHIESLYAQSLS
jgi:hypothetical protein